MKRDNLTKDMFDEETSALVIRPCREGFDVIRTGKIERLINRLPTYAQAKEFLLKLQPC